MKIVVVGGSGLVGAKLVTHLHDMGHEVVPASRRTGIDAASGAGLAAVLEGADAVVDVTNASSFEEPAVSDYFRRSSSNLLAASADAGIKHYLALSVVGTSRLVGSPYFNAKALQEQLVRRSSVPHTLVQATQFFEFMASIIPPGAGKDLVQLPSARVQPVAADDVAKVLADLVTQPPSGTTVEIAGPERFKLNELVQWVMYAYQDDRPVVADVDALYYGAVLDDDTLMPRGQATLGPTTFKDWLNGYVTGSVPIPRVNIPRPL